jgi:anti-sigma B factor antagonist
LRVSDDRGEDGIRLDRAYFSLEVQRDGTTLALRLAGEFDWAVIGHVEGALEKALQTPTEQIVFDLSALEFLDAAGLTTILKANERARRRRVNLTVVRPRGRANAIFALTGADEKLAIVDAA